MLEIILKIIKAILETINYLPKRMSKSIVKKTAKIRDHIEILGIKAKKRK
jgi:hypothetical protein